MKQILVAAAMMAAGLVAQAEGCRPGVRLLTVHTADTGNVVPKDVMGRARATATKLLAGARITVEWAEGELRIDPEQAFCGERLMVAFDAKAAARFPKQSMAYSNVVAGMGTAIHMFYDRISSFQDNGRMPEFLGGLLAHEICHMLEGVARHSSMGVMKVRWTERDLEEMAAGRLCFAPEDVKMMQERFSGRVVAASKSTKRL